MLPNSVRNRSATGSPISRYRTADAVVTVTANGVPLANQEVVVAQRHHKFRFGCSGRELLPPPAVAGGPIPNLGSDVSAEARLLQSAANEALAELWLDLFNYATLTLYWHRFEPVRGQPHTERLLAEARWFAERGIPVKGHPLVWHTLAPPWLMDLSNPDIARAVVDRVERDVMAFAGTIDTWDAINEAVIMPVFDKYDNGITRICREVGRVPMVRMVFDAARRANPEATLVLNDFDISGAFENLIEEVLEAGVRIDALGLQTHMHQGYFGDEKILSIVERLAQVGLPVHFTETTLVSGHLMPPHFVDLNDYQIDEWPSTPDGEERQADDVVRLYTTLLSHPSIQAITYWGMRDGGWLNAPGGLVRADGSPKPSYHALHSLIKREWWLPPTRAATDTNGRLRVTGFLGDYEISASGTTATFRLDQPGPAAVDVELAATSSRLTADVPTSS